MNCRNCGTEIKKGENFCTGCGAPAPKTPLERFEQALSFVMEKEKFMMDKNFDGVNPELVANKIIYQTLDKTIREKLSEEDNIKLDKANERKGVLERLKEEVETRSLSEVDLNEILELKEFKEYMDSAN